jgi:YbbR domain-containing protein
MARISESITRNAGSKVLALAAALALWVLVAARQAPEEAAEGNMIEAAVPVEPAWRNAELSEILIEDFTIIPESLRIAGPANRVSLLARLATQPIDVAAIPASGVVEAAVILPDPQLRFVDNPLVRVELKVRPR